MFERLKWTYRAWRYRFKVEPQEVAFVLQRLRPGAVAVDIGAHKGAFTYWMSRCVGPSGRVVAFEPQPALTARLRKLVAAAPHVVVEGMALSDRCGQLTLHVPGRTPSPGASLNARPAGLEDGCATYQVDVTTLDDYFRRSPVPRVDFIKCDAEGHELEVFRGAQQTLVDHQPDLMFECETRHRQGRPVQEVFHFLEQIGYRGFYLGPDDLVDIDRFDPEIHQADPESADYVNNFAFVSRPKAKSLAA